MIYDNDKLIKDILGSTQFRKDGSEGEGGRRARSWSSIVGRQYITSNTEKSSSGRLTTLLRNEGNMLKAAASKSW